MKRSGLCAFLMIALAFAVSVALLGAPPSERSPSLERPEQGRELIGPDGRTLTDKEYRYSVQLPAPDWKVYRRLELGIGGKEPTLEIFTPDQEYHVTVRARFVPGPIKKLKEFMENEAKKQGQPFQRSSLGVRKGVPYWEFEGESPSATGPDHTYGRIYERDAVYKITAGVQLSLARWQKDQKILREMIDNVRVNP